MKITNETTNENVLAYILKRHRSILNLSQRFGNEKKLRLEGKIRYGRLPHKDRGMYLRILKELRHCYVPEMPPEGVQIVGTMEETEDKADAIRGTVVLILSEWEAELIKDAQQADLAVDVCEQILQAIEDSADD